MLQNAKDKIRIYKNKKLKEKKRKREQKARTSGKFGQTKLKQSQKGVYSCMVAVLVALVLLLLLVVAFTTHGKAAAVAGSIGLMEVFFCWVGVLLGIHGLREREKNYRTCKIGIVANGVILLLLVVTFFRGFL